MDKKQRIIIIVIAFALVLLCGGLTYAYFTSATPSETGSTIVAKGGTMSIKYANGSGNIILENIYPRSSAWVNKTFTVTGNNTTDLNMYYGISLVVDNNEFYNYLSYTLTGINTSNNGSLIPDVTTNQMIFDNGEKTELGIGSFNKATNAVHTYNLKIFFLDNGGKQNYLQGANFAAHLTIDSINPDGSVAYVGQGRNIEILQEVIPTISKDFSAVSEATGAEKYVASLIIEENNYDTGDLTYTLTGTNSTNNGTMIINASNVSIPYGYNQQINLGEGMLSNSGTTKHDYQITIKDNTVSLSSLSKEYKPALLAKQRYFKGRLEISSGNKTIYSAVIEQGTKESPTTSIGTAATTNEGLIKTTDDYGTAYYYRGAAENNYVKFAGMCWRIVRTTGNNNVKLVLYNNDSDNCALTGDDLAYAKFASNYTSPFNLSNTYEMDEIVDSAFMYGQFFATDANRCLMVENDKIVDKSSSFSNNIDCYNAGGRWARTMYDAAFANLKKSTSLMNLETWYKAKLESYTSKLADVIWCNDKKTASTSTTSVTFAINQRMQSGFSMVCNDDNLGGSLNKYTVYDEINGNGELTYPIGLLTADEVVFAGGSVSGDMGSTYLIKNISSNAGVWTMTPVGWYYNDGNTHVAFNAKNFVVTYSSANYYLRPSIALKGSVGVSGSGSASDPFVVR